MMTAAFYIAAFVAVAATALAITRVNAVHALLYLVASLLAVAVVFYLLGAPFVAALEAIIYAGAIMVLFIFVVMMLNVGPATEKREHAWLTPRIWAGPALLSAILLGELLWLGLSAPVEGQAALQTIDSKSVGIVLLGPYLIGVELASMLLLAALVAAYHLGRGGQGPAR
jgi:NADH-quinone oxidoreductase subunit J